MRHALRRQVAFHRRKLRSREELAQLKIAVPREPGAQILGAFARRQIAAQQSFECLRHFSRRRAIAYRSSSTGPGSDGTSDTKVIGIDQFAALFDLLAFKPDVCDPMLPTTVGTSGNVQLELLIEFGNTRLQLLDQPARER